jgi:hypothetical protein
MFTRQMRRKHQAELLSAAWPTCVPSLPGGGQGSPAVSIRLEAGNNVALWHRYDCQLPKVEATS